jgi:myotubularin-related protein 5/13
MVEDDFLTKVLESTAYSAFVAERGPPYRICDIFDEVYATLNDIQKEEALSNDRDTENVKELASQLYIHVSMETVSLGFEIEDLCPKKYSILSVLESCL